MNTIRRILGPVVALACLAWVLHGLDRATFLRGIKGIHWGWVAVGISFDILSYVSQGWRWRLLMEPSGRLSTMQATRAIYAGLFTNEVMPLRLGEIVRAYLASRWTGVSIGAVIPTIALERLLDGVWLIAGVLVTAVFVPLPEAVRKGAWIASAVVASGVVAAIWAARRKQVSESRFGRTMDAISRQVRQAARTGRLVNGFLASGILLAGQVLAFWAILRACNLPYGILASSVVLLIVHLGTAVPNAPANVGSYQFLVVVGLTLFGTDKATAGTFSVVVFVILTVPLWLLGYMAIRTRGTTFAQLRSEVAAAIS